MGQVLVEPHHELGHLADVDELLGFLVLLARQVVLDLGDPADLQGFLTQEFLVLHEVPLGGQGEPCVLLLDAHLADDGLVESLDFGVQLEDAVGLGAFALVAQDFDVFVVQWSDLF